MPRRFMERETGIEPASLAWKARVLPLNYSRVGWISTPLHASRAPHKSHIAIASKSLAGLCCEAGGGGWIRTSVGVSQQIYSLPPLATRAPLRRTSKYSTFLPGRSSGGLGKPPARELLLVGRAPRLPARTRRRRIAPTPPTER